MGAEAIKTQLEPYKKCAVPSLYYGTHAWRNITASEIKCLEQIQTNILKGILGLPFFYPIHRNLDGDRNMASSSKDPVLHHYILLFDHKLLRTSSD